MLASPPSTLNSFRNLTTTNSSRLDELPTPVHPVRFYFSPQKGGAKLTMIPGGASSMPPQSASPGVFGSASAALPITNPASSS